MLGRFALGGREYTLVEWHAAPADGERVDPMAASALLRSVALDELARFELRRTLGDAGFDLTHVDLVDAVERALCTGRVVLLDGAQSVEPHVFSLVAPPQEEVAPEPAPAPEYDWIEVELADEDGVAIMGAELELKMPDGSVRRARTNEHGRFHVPRTDSGQCELRWLQVHPVERARRFAPAAAAEA